MSDSNPGLEGIAIIGMAGRFPGAKNVREFWRNLVAGKETISFFDSDELDPVPSEAEVRPHAALEGISISVGQRSGNIEERISIGWLSRFPCIR